MSKEISRYERIKKLCKERGISITTLEKELGFSRGSISKIDKNEPSSKRLEMIAAYFDVPVQYLSDPDYFYFKREIDYKVNYEYFKNFLLLKDMIEEPDIKKLFDKYRALDSHGKDIVNTILQKEYERVTSTYAMPNAAHQRTDVEVTDEMKKHDEDIMNDPDF